jgi:predicted NAD/FAD-binding protein
MVKSLLISGLLVLLVLAVGPIAANNTANASLHNEGLSHVCTDAKIIDASQRYTNQQKTNATHHTAEFMNGGYHEDFKASAAALCNAVELTKARTDKSSPIDNMPILGYNNTSSFDNMSIPPPETHDNMSNLPSLKQQQR